MKFKLVSFCLAIFATLLVRAQSPTTLSNETSTVVLSNRTALVTVSNGLGTISFSNNFFNGACTVEGQIGQRWVVLDSFFTTQRVGQVTMPLQTNGYRRFRLKCTEISPNKSSRTVFNRLAGSYGNIHTIAGKEQVPPGVNAWTNTYEGEYATNVNLSNPCCAMTDEAGNIYVVEQDGHAVLKISVTNGRIYTVMGKHVPGYNGDDLEFPSDSLLNSPNGLWVTSGRVYVLDTGNSRIRYEQGGVILSLVPKQRMLPTFNQGGGLWVAPDESEAFIASGTELLHYKVKATGGSTLDVEASGFREVGNVLVNAAGRTIVCDPLDNRIYRVRGSGEKLLIAGDGFQRSFPNFGDADKVSLPGARSIWYLPIGGYFVGLDEGAKIWYVDSDDNAAPFVFGKPGVHAGDGRWFRKPGPKIGNVKSVTMTPHGDIIIVEGSFVRQIDFKRHLP